jgi:hypothetical protein
MPNARGEMFGVDFPSFITYDADNKSEKLKMMAAVLSRPAKPWPSDATFIRLMMPYKLSFQPDGRMFEIVSYHHHVNASSLTYSLKFHPYSSYVRI